MTVAVETSDSKEQQTLEDEDYWCLPNRVDSSSEYAIRSSGTQTSESDGIESKRSVSCSSGDSSTICRICQDGEKIEDLTTLCNCTGSVAKYHVTCLERWLSVSKSDVCELCHGRFQTNRKAKPFVEWLRYLRSSPQSRYMFGDILCLLVLTPLALASAALCGEGSWYYISVGQLIIAFALVFLCAFVVLLYVVWLVLSVRYHRMMWQKWRQDNQVVKLVIPASTRTSVTAMKTTVV